MLFLSSIAQISIQNPLSDEWMVSPLHYDEECVKAINPDFSKFIKPIEARRMGSLIKRAIATSMSALEDAGLSGVEAVIGGTGHGQVVDTQALLTALCFEGENSPQPTHFMQSTHNTIASQIAMRLHCHGYNSTYVQGGISFECAMYDAMLQLKAGLLRNALVTANDEITPEYFTLLKRAGYVDKFPCSETSVSLVLDTKPTKEALCVVESVDVLHKPEQAEIERVIGDKSDTLVFEADDFKPLFGDNFSVSALCFYGMVKRLLASDKGRAVLVNRFDRDAAVTIIRKC